MAPAEGAISVYGVKSLNNITPCGVLSGGVPVPFPIQLFILDRRCP
jgi:hypothetical protein